MLGMEQRTYTTEDMMKIFRMGKNNISYFKKVGIIRPTTIGITDYYTIEDINNLTKLIIDFKGGVIKTKKAGATNTGRVAQ